MKKGNVLLWIFIFLILLTILVFVIIFFLPKITSSPQLFPQGREPPLNSTVYLKARDVSGNLINAVYTVKRTDGQIVKSGFIRPEAYEELPFLFSNYSYSLVARLDGYYSRQIDFNYDAGRFYVDLEPAPQLEIRSSKQLNGYSIQINPSIRNGVLCEAHGANIIFFYAFDSDFKELPKISIPSFISSLYDHCFELGNFNRSKSFFINFTNYPLEKGDFIDLMVLDRDLSVNANAFALDFKDGESNLGSPDSFYRLNLTD